MIWIYTLIALTLYISLFFYHKKSKKKFNRWKKAKKSDFIKDIRENWKELRIKTEDCVVINFDTKVNKNSATYSMSIEKESFYDWMNRDPKRIDLVDVSRTKILCKQKIDGQTINEFFTIVNKDTTIVEFKLRMRDYVSIYFLDNLDNENFFIDLEFLNEEIDKTKFNTMNKNSDN